MSSIDYSGLIMERELKKLELENGLVPFDEWFDTLRDRRMQAAVDTRLARVRAGNFGDHKFVGGRGIRVAYRIWTGVARLLRITRPGIGRADWRRG